MGYVVSFMSPFQRQLPLTLSKCLRKFRHSLTLRPITPNGKLNENIPTSVNVLSVWKERMYSLHDVVTICYIKQQNIIRKINKFDELYININCHCWFSSSLIQIIHDCFSSISWKYVYLKIEIFKPKVQFKNISNMQHPDFG